MTKTESPVRSSDAPIIREFSMKRIVVSLIVTAVGFGTFTHPASAQAIQSIKKYANCSQLNKVHPGGIARSDMAAKSATLSGYLKPTVSKSAYEASKKYGDYAGTGFSCPKFGKSTLGTIKFKTDWGYITARKVHRPKNGICVYVPIVVDVRNASKINSIYSFGIKITLEDDFENIIGYQEWSGATNESLEAKNGKFNTSLKVCKARHSWKHFSGNRDFAVQPISSENWYWLNSYSWLRNEFQGRSDFEFKK